MLIGTVLGDVRLRECAVGYEQISFRQVRLEDRLVVAADLVGAQAGDLVLLTEGAAAAGYRMDLRCDALILGKVEKQK